MRSKHLLFVFVFLIFCLNINPQKYSNILKPWTYWWWMGSSVTEKGINESLEAMCNAGIGGVHIIPIYGVKGDEKNYRKSYVVGISLLCDKFSNTLIDIDIPSTQTYLIRYRFSKLHCWGARKSIFGNRCNGCLAWTNCRAYCCSRIAFNEMASVSKSTILG